MYESRDNPASFSTRSTIYLKNLEPYTNRIITNHSRGLVNLRLKDMFSRRESPNRDSPPWSTPFLFDEQSALKGLNWLTPYTHLCFASSTRNRISNFRSIPLPSPSSIVTRIFRSIVNVGSSLTNGVLITGRFPVIYVFFDRSILVIETLSKKKRKTVFTSRIRLIWLIINYSSSEK